MELVSASHRFTATLRRPQGARVVKGTAEGCRAMGDVIYVVYELLRANDAIDESVTSLKITISPITTKRRKP